MPAYDASARSPEWSAATWRTLARYQALIEINPTQHTYEELHRRHGTVLGEPPPLVERGQADGGFRRDVPAAWDLGMCMALVRGESAQLRACQVREEHAQAALVATILGAITDQPSSR